MAVLIPQALSRSERMRFGWRALCASVMVFMLAPAEWVAAAAPVLSEYQIKAVFLYNFAQFVDWPPAAFPTPESPLIIGVLGEDPMGSSLDAAVRGETVGGRPLAVRRYRQPAEIGACHILFISRSQMSRLEQVLSTVENRSILTVADAPGFCERGGMICFVTKNRRVRMQINLEAATRARLTLSSKLLRPAEIVRGGRG